MNNKIKSEMVKSSAKMEMEELLDGKSEDFIEGFNVAMQFSSDYMKALLVVYFDMSGRNS